MEDQRTTVTDADLDLLLAEGSREEPILPSPATPVEPGERAGREAIDSQILAGLVSP